MEDFQDRLPVRLFAESLALIAVPGATIIFFVSLIGSGGVGEGPRHDAQLLFRAEFMAGLVIAALAAGIPLASLLLRDPKASLQRWVLTGMLCGVVVGVVTLAIMVWEMVLRGDVPPELVGNWITGILVFGLMGAVAALPIRALTLYRFRRRR